MLAQAPATALPVTPAAAAVLHRSEQPKRLQEQLVDAIRTRHYSRRTEQAYWHWVRQFVLWSGKRHPLEIGAPEIGRFLSYLATQREVAASTQRQDLARSCRHRGVRALIRILYWTGMRVSEAQRAERAPGVLILRDTKNGSPRLVPALPIITTACAVPMPRRSEIDYYWPLARAACGLEHVRLHDIRHTAASGMVAAGEDLGTVGAVLGHKSAQTTKRYAHYAVPRLAAALKRRA